MGLKNWYERRTDGQKKAIKWSGILGCSAGAGLAIEHYLHPIGRLWNWIQGDKPQPEPQPEPTSQYDYESILLQKDAVDTVLLEQSAREGGLEALASVGFDGTHLNANPSMYSDGIAIGENDEIDHLIIEHTGNNQYASLTYFGKFTVNGETVSSVTVENVDANKAYEIFYKSLTGGSA